MSRFFETLKEASRSPVGSIDAVLNDREQSAASDSDRSPVLEKVNGAGVSAPPDPQPTAPTAEVPRAAQPDFAPPESLFDAFAPRRRGFSGSKRVQITLSPVEALIPNATSVAVVERYRRLRSKLQQEHGTTPIRSLLIASPGPGEGKTITTLNLAYSFGMLPDFKVVVIDGDLRRGKIAHTLGTPDTTLGLGNLLDGSASLSDIVLTSDSTPFSFIVSGNSQTPPAELLTSTLLPETMRELALNFDLVLMDSPPVNLFSDTQSLAESCDAVLVVARAFATTSKALERTLHDLQPFRIVGTVLNGGAAPERQKYYYKRYFSGNHA
jgi:capsular exopolysaccharide synthesis family protein